MLNLFKKQCPYEVGDILTTSNATAPSTRWPGTTWKQLTNVFIYAAGSKAVNTTGGEETHTLTVSEMPNHNHENLELGDAKLSAYSKSGSGTIYNMESLIKENAKNNYNFTIGNAGGGAAHNNMPPYVVKYMWERTA